MMITFVVVTKSLMDMVFSKNVNLHRLNHRMFCPCPLSWIKHLPNIMNRGLTIPYHIIFYKLIIINCLNGHETHV